MLQNLSTSDKIKMGACGLAFSVVVGFCAYLVTLGKEEEKAQTRAVAEARSGLEALVECHKSKTGADPAVSTETKEWVDGVFLKPATLSFLRNGSMEDDAITALAKLSDKLRREPSRSGEVIPEFMARYGQFYAYTVARLQFLRFPVDIENMKTMRSIKITGKNSSVVGDSRITSVSRVYLHSPDFKVLSDAIRRYGRFERQMREAAAPLFGRSENVVFFDRGFRDGYATFLDSYLKAAAVRRAGIVCAHGNRDSSQDGEEFAIPRNDHEYVFQCVETPLQDLFQFVNKDYDPDGYNNAKRFRAKLDKAIEIRGKELEKELDGSVFADADYFYSLGEFLLWDRQGCLKITNTGFEVDRTRLFDLTGVLGQYIEAAAAYLNTLSSMKSREVGDLFDFPRFGKNIFGEDHFLRQKNSENKNGRKEKDGDIKSRRMSSNQKLPFFSFFCSAYLGCVPARRGSFQCIRPDQKDATGHDGGFAGGSRRQAQWGRKRRWPTLMFLASVPWCLFVPPLVATFIKHRPLCRGHEAACLHRCPREPHRSAEDRIPHQERRP